MLRTFFLLLNTIKFLQFTQLYYRLYYRLYKIKVAPLESYAANVCQHQLNWQGMSFVPQSVFSNATAFFLNRQISIASEASWNDSSVEKLWLYNLHYMDELSAKNSSLSFLEQKDYVLRWIEENPAPVGNGWEPYTLSLRLVNLIKWCWVNRVDDRIILASIAQQADALSQQLEFHILANHLFANAKALVFAGCFLAGKTGGIFLNLGCKVLQNEIDEQFLDDGAHFELSPMYHSVLLFDVLELIELTHRADSALLKAMIPKLSVVAVNGLRWLENMCHPDGDISFFNDATVGVAPKISTIKRYALRLGLQIEARAVPNCVDVVTMPNSGYSVVYIGSIDSKLFINHAEIGPSYQPGHAHADTLSFELSLFGRRVIVNSGVSQYGLGEQRDFERSTQAHNTVTVNNADSSEVWAGFRVGRRARVIKFSKVLFDGEAVISAAHDGYRRFKRSIVHARTWRASKNCISILDRLENLSSHKVKSYYHFHPDVKVIVAENNQVELSISGHCQVKISIVNGRFRIEPYNYHPGFGCSKVSYRLVADWVSSEQEVNISWREID